MQPSPHDADDARAPVPADLFRPGARLPHPRIVSAAGSGARRGLPTHAGRAAAMPPEQRRAAILAAAAPLLRQHGHDVTTRQIAQAAGIAEGTVFRAFRSKQAIVDAAVAQAFDASGTVQRIRAIDPAQPLQQRVRACARILADRLASVIELMIALRMHGPPQPPAGLAERHRAHHESQSEMLAAIAAIFAPDADRLRYPAERAAHLLRLLAFAGTHRGINDDDPLSPDEITDVLLDGIVRAAPDPDGLPPPGPSG